MPIRKTDESPVYQLKVTLRASKPPIWRRIQVRGSTTLPKLHVILQIVMGWSNYHLHQFTVGNLNFGVPDPQWDLGIRSEQRIHVGEIVFAVKDRFVYEYDFGDGWEHKIVVEKVLPPQPGMHYPICLTGRRACPPEDVGGIWGYAEFVKAIQDPKHPEHADLLAWVGGSFDLLAFDVEAINRRLEPLRPVGE